VLPAALACALASCALSERGDACDDDADNDEDGRVDCADTDCLLAPPCQPCGDGDVGDNEACDDGNLDNDDGCSDRCLIEGCGDGVREPGEACDDGNLIAADGCDFRCRVNHCGDHTVQPAEGEECDDGNPAAGDGCSSGCRIERGVLCGNGIFDVGEGCDDGNRRDGDGCGSTCLQEFCGDGIRQPRLGEQCDGRDTPTAANGDAQQCEFCQIVRCGNLSIEAQFGEDCDDGNRQGGDGCSRFCRTERCGDFEVLPPEQCDDGNPLSGDGCSSTCAREICGDGVRQPRLGELCDDDSEECVGCSLSRACAQDACFALSRGQPELLPSSVALLAGAPPRAVLGSLSSFALFTYDIDGGLAGGASLFDNFSSLNAVRGADLDGDGTDELMVVSSDFSAGLFQLETKTYQRHLSFNDRVFDVGAVDLGGSADLELVAVSRTGELSAFVNGTTITLPLGAIATRVAAAPVRAGIGVVVASGHTLLGVRPDEPTAPTALVLDGTLELDAAIKDLASADIDGDGVAELVVLVSAPDEMRVLFLDGDGLPDSATLLADAAGADAISAADVDSDGADDLIATDERATMTLHVASGGFAPVSLPSLEGCTRAAARDVDGDGDVDLLIGGGFARTDALLFLQE
jgi:cysteine-rich repeat protein